MSGPWRSIGAFSAMIIRESRSACTIWRSSRKTWAILSRRRHCIATRSSARNSIYGDRHPETAIAKGNYGLLLQREGRLAEAEPLLRDAVAMRLSLYGPDHYKVGYARVSLAMLLHDKGDLAGSRKRISPSARDLRQIAARESSVSRGTAHAFRAPAGGSRINPPKRLPRATNRSRSGPRPRRPSSPQTALAHAIHAYALEHLANCRRRPRNSTPRCRCWSKRAAPTIAVVRRAQSWQKIARPQRGTNREHRAACTEPRHALDANQLPRNNRYAGLSVSSVYAYCSSLMCNKKSVWVSGGT